MLFYLKFNINLPFARRYLYFKIMQVNSAEQSGNGRYKMLTFQMVKKLRYGKAVFVCGGCEHLGNWMVKNALRLEWGEGDKWQGCIAIQEGDVSRVGVIEFKFMVGEWSRGENSIIEWQIGKINRRINIQSISKGNNIYYAEWNMQTYIFFLRTHDFQEKQTYYIEGSLQVLGAWKEKKIMKRLQPQKTNIFINYWKNNPQFAQESFSRIFMVKFSASRDIEAFNYFYVSFGTTLQSETYPGRTYRLGANEPTKDRIMQLDWQGSKVIIDESTFDNMIFERFTNQIYLASHIHNYQQFHRIIEKNVTALFIIMGKNQDYRYSSFDLKTLCKETNIVTSNRTIDEIDNEDFVTQINKIVEDIEELIIKGHRVCLNMSNRIMKLIPIHMLYLILFLKYSFGEALEIVSRNGKPSEAYCKKTRQINNFISAKFNKGRVQVKQ